MPRNDTRAKAYLMASAAVHGALSARLDLLTGDAKAQLLADIANAARAAVDAVWDIAHDEGHRCPTREHMVPRGHS